jgi:uncharacterized protein (TIGR01777 family)
LIPKTVLITGASGLIGSQLSKMLIEQGYLVKQLSRSKEEGSVHTYRWSINEAFIKEGALEAVDAIVHLAGAGIADQPWNEKRKREILESRTRSTRLLHHYLKTTRHQVKTLVSASGIGYYGSGFSDEVFTEDHKPAGDFLASVVKQWEDEEIGKLGIRTVKIRTGIVLSEKGGALKELVQPIKWGVGAPLGSGNQYMTWIHLDDLCRMYLYAIENEAMQGAYNGVGPTWCTNREITREIARVLKRPLWLPPIPGFVLKMVLGEMADLVLKGSKVSSAKIQQAGFTFRHDNLGEALNDLLVH